MARQTILDLVLQWYRIIQYKKCCGILVLLSPKSIHSCNRSTKFAHSRSSLIKGHRPLVIPGMLEKPLSGNILRALLPGKGNIVVVYTAEVLADIFALKALRPCLL